MDNNNENLVGRRWMGLYEVMKFEMFLEGEMRYDLKLIEVS